MQKNSHNHLSKVSPERQKEQKQQLQNNNQTTNNPKWGLWGLLYLLLIGNLIFVVKKAVAEEPGEVNKKALDDEIFFAKSYEDKADDYEAEGYNAYMTALAELQGFFRRKAEKMNSATACPSFSAKHGEKKAIGQERRNWQESLKKLAVLKDNEEKWYTKNRSRGSARLRKALC
jgi:hypothetical protein